MTPRLRYFEQRYPILDIAIFQGNERYQPLEVLGQAVVAFEASCRGQPYARRMRLEDGSLVP